MDRSLLVTSFINPDLWSKAGWQGVAFLGDPQGTRPPAIGLLFSNQEPAGAIFRDWIARIGKVDTNELLRVSIVEGATDHPTDYFVTISTDLDALIAHADRNGKNLENVDMLTVVRVHQMTQAPGSPHLASFKRDYRAFHEYTILPVYAGVSLQQARPDMSLGIQKTKILLRRRDELSTDDPDHDAILSRESSPKPKLH